MILISGGTIIDPTLPKGDRPFTDILIDKGVVVQLGYEKDFSSTGDIEERIDAQGMWICPGGIDLHVHLREPGFEWKETIQSGSEAAVLGGFTSICCMPNTEPRNDNGEITRYILSKAKDAEAARVLPIGAVTKGLLGKELSLLSELRDAGCVAFSDDGEPIYNAGIMRRALEWSRMLDAVICCHEEDKSLSCGGVMNESPLSYRLGLSPMPMIAEEVMVARDIELARVTKSKVHICHISSARGVELIRRAKNDGISITAEVTPHHLMLTEEAVEGYDTNAKMSPPLRQEEEVAALIEGLKDGTIDCVASDHAPHEIDSKRVEFGKAAFGILGLQTSLPLLLDFVHRGILSPNRAIEAISSNPARIFGLPYGTLRKGSPADIILIRPNEKWTFGSSEVRSKSQNSPFIGRSFEGRVDTVFVGGKKRVSQGQLK